MRLPFLIFLLLAAAARAATIQTLDGKSFTGDLHLQTDQILIAPAQGTSSKIPLSEILSAQFKEAAPLAAANARWIGHDIGSPPVQGSGKFVAGNVIIKGSGADIGLDRDEGYFVYQQLAGDGQITARLTSIGKTNVLAKAGVMIRGSIDKSAPSAIAMIQANDRAAFRYRSRIGGVSTTLGERDSELPSWLRLVRRNDLVKGYVSDDGIDWQELGSATLFINGPALIGVAVTSHNNNAVSTASFEKVSIGGLDAFSGAAPGSPSRGVMLRDGSVLSGEVRSATDSAIRLRRDGNEISIPPSDISRIVFIPLSPQLMTRLANPRAGLLLSSGDVVEGEFKGITDGKVAVSSVLFGLQRFNLLEVAAVIMRDTPPAPAPRNYELRIADGSIIFVDKLTSDAANLFAETSFAGKLKFTQDDIIEIRAGSARFKPLTDLKPSALLGPADSISIVTSASSKIAVRGQFPTRLIRLSTASSITYKLDNPYRLLALRFAIPDGILPVSPLRLVVLADGKEIHRTASMTSLDDPFPIGIKLAGAKSITLRLESDGPAQLPSAAVLIDPALIQ